MKILKKIGIGIGVLLAIFLILGIFVKKEYTVERQVSINKPKQEVFAYIQSLKNQDNFSYWAKQDPEMKKSYVGTDGTPGFVSMWDGDKMEKGEQEIIKIDEGSRIDYALRFKKPMEDNATAYMTTENASENQTTVKWGVQGKMGYPMNALQLFGFMESMMGKQLETGLNNLKTLLESSSNTTTTEPVKN